MQALVSLSLWLYILHPVACRRHHHTTDLCDPCAGSSPVSDSLFLDRVAGAAPCHSLWTALVQVRELSMAVSDDARDMVDSLFDGDVSHLDEDPLNYLVPYEVSPMAHTYGKLVHLHFCLKLIENHPSKSMCGVNSTPISDRLPVCHLLSATGSTDARSSGLESVCKRRGSISLTSCPQVQRYAYRVLVTSGLILREVRRDLRRFLTNRRCFIDT